MKKDPRRRYSATPRFAYAEGAPRPFDGLMPRRMLAQDGYVTHVIVDGDRLDRLATQYFGDPRLWWAIAQANPGLVDPASLLYAGGAAGDMAELRVGEEIQIPARPSEPQ